MLDRRPESQIQREIEAAQATRFGRLATATQEVLNALRTYSHLVEFLVVISIISIVAALLWPRYLQAKDAAYVTTCLANLNQLGVAMELYNIDYDAYPTPRRWHQALRRHLGPLEDDVDPFKCKADRTAAPTSYYYLDASLLTGAQHNRRLTDTPMLVDETYHANVVTVRWYDGHQNSLDPIDWLDLRSDVLQIQRDTEHPEWMCFLPTAAQTEEGGTRTLPAGETADRPLR